MTVASLFTFSFNVVMLKKIVVNFFVVIFILSIFDFTIGKTLRYFYFKETSGRQYRTTYSIDSTKADILVFGSSRASHHYVPEVFEDTLKMSFYNTGRDGNGIFFQLALLKSVLKRYTPRVILLDYADNFGIGDKDYDRLSSLLPYYKAHVEIRNIVELKSPYERIKLISEIYPFNSEILSIAIGNLQINKNRKPDNKGYVALYNEYKIKIDSINNPTASALDSNKLMCFREFIKTAKISGANIAVVYSPLFRKFNTLQEIEICKKYCFLEKIPFWDFSKDTSFSNNSRLFQDAYHLNHIGALKLSNLVAKKIKQSQL